MNAHIWMGHVTRTTFDDVNWECAAAASHVTLVNKSRIYV